MKKKLKMIFFGLSIVILIISLIYIVTFMSRTIRSGDVEKYCIDNTTTNATSFVRYGVTSDPSYAFWIAEDSLSNLQEIFIFKKAQIGSINRTKRFNRFSFVYHTSSSIDEGIGSIMFMPRDDKNKKKSTNLLIFYSSNNNRITSYTLTFEENGDECTRKGKVSTEQPFIVSISGLGVNDGVTRKFIKVEFFDDEGILVGSKGQ